MIGIQGITAVPESTGPRQGSGKVKNPEKTVTARASDGVSISPEAEQAAGTNVAVHQAIAENEVRQEKVEQAKQSIEQGTYKVQDVVRQVASRLTKFVS
jgi:flagellar biosynthesis anti-sigma factor FlgM